MAKINPHGHRFAAGDISRLVEPEKVEFLGHKLVELFFYPDEGISVDFVSNLIATDVSARPSNNSKYQVRNRAGEEFINLEYGFEIIERALGDNKLYLAQANLTMPEDILEMEVCKKVGYGDLYREIQN